VLEAMGPLRDGGEGDVEFRQRLETMYRSWNWKELWQYWQENEDESESPELTFMNEE
jgi:hypothetical protein